MRVAQGLEVPMRDGVVLRADAYLPDAERPVPAILSRTPYDRSFPLTPVAAIDPEHATEAGFALVCQDVRGQHGSDGQFTPFKTEGPDGYDTVEWVAAQPWCSGAVGMAGRSYPAATQWRAAVEQPPHLRAIFPVLVGSDLYDGWIYQGGAFELGFNLFWVHLMTSPKARGSLDEHYRHLPISDPPLLADSPAGDFYREWIAHPTYDEHWRRLSLRGRYGEIDVPAFNVGGWFDIFLGGTLENFARLRGQGGSPRSRSGTRLLVGPWGHGTAFGSFPDHRFKEFGTSGNVDLADLQLRFFEAHLGSGDEARDEAPVRIFVMGENIWRDEWDWPLARATTEHWFLHSRGDAAGGGGGLSPEAPGAEPEDEYAYDPRDPAPTVGGPISLPGKMMRPSAGPLDQTALEERPDVLVYSSEPLEAPLEVTGPLELVLYAATSARDTDFIGKLCDVDPDGRSRILAEGVIRARYREGFEQAIPVAPDRVNEYRIYLVATSNVFLPGHRIRLDVTSSSFPRFDRNAGSGNTVGKDTEDSLTTARQRIFHDADRASHLLLPVVER
ncbi:MAG: CocE/NonD family hydrolase [Solirubrobacterales bacterium]